MNEKNIKREDQANELRKLFNEVQGEETSFLPIEENFDKQNVVYASKNDSSEINEPTRKVDILNLPPRKEIHGDKKNRTRIKFSRPFLRFSVIILLLIAVISAVYYVWGEELIQLPLDF